MITLGVDVGTSGVKLLAMDETGKVLKVVSREYPIYQDGNASEQDPEDWWTQTVDGLKELTAEVKNIEAVSFSGQMHGLVLIDKDGNVLRRAILWNDLRTTPQCDYLNNVVGKEKLLEHAANTALEGYTLPKLLWVKDNEPEIFAKIHKIMLPKDYVAYKLSGRVSIDEADGSGTMLLDVKKREWSPFMMEVAGIAVEQLPDLFPSIGVVGTVTPEAAKVTGLSENTKVVIGGGDQPVGAVGTGTVSGGMCSLSLGTSGVVFVASDHFTVDRSSSVLSSFCHSNGRYFNMGVANSSAGSTKWWVNDILGHDDYAAEEKAINIGDLGNNKVYYLPYLNGERNPINDPYARGAFVGMSSTTSRADMHQAILEGVAYSLRHILDAIRALGTNTTSARIIGGGAKSPLWCQIVANVLNLRVDKINSADGAALGAAILAAVGAGGFATVEEACAKLITVTESFEPDQAVVARYDKHYPMYKNLYEALKDSFKNIHELH